LGNNDLDGTYLKGAKAQPIAYSGDLSRVFIGGTGLIYVIDTITQKIVDRIHVDNGKNIGSLVCVGNTLIVGESCTNSAGASGARLLAFDVTPKKPDAAGLRFNYTVIQDTGIDKSPNGVAGMVMGPDGKTLVVAVPNDRDRMSTSIANPKKRGDVLIFDLDTLSMKTGKIAAPFVVQRPADDLSGKVPHSISATKDPDQFLISNILDYDKGLSTLQLKRDEQGNVIDATMTPIKMGQNRITVDRLDIQRADSSVLIEKDGVEYAIVADDNFNYNDPYYRAMFEPPSFLWTPGGSPILVGGSVSAKKVAVGGKLGIIQDPFGKKGSPKFLGATLPLDGYGIRNLSVSEDGKVLLGQLYGGYGTDNPNVQKEHQTHVWNVGAIIDAALAMTDKDREIHHIKFTDKQNDTINNEQRVDAGAGVPIGTYFDPEPVVVKVEGNLGDVIEVDLKRMIAHELLGLPKPGPKLTDAEKALINQKNAQIQEIIDNIDNFNFVANEKTKLTDVSKKDERAFTLVTNDKLEPISQDKNGKDATFKDEGRLFMAANLMQKATEKKSGNHTGDTVVERLRKGENIKGGMSENFLITYQLKKDIDPGNGKAKIAKGSGTANVTVTANDFAKAKDTIFFGDRDLKNPGYSAFKLSGDVKVGSTNTLDVYRVEQRLQYLGYGVAAAAVNGAGEVTVDGKLDSKEEVDLRMFRQIVAGKTEYDAKEGSKPAVTEKVGKKTVVKVPEGLPTPVEVKKGSDLENWLNAFNAPHWMRYEGFGKDDNSLKGWEDKTGADKSNLLGTSWVFDLMAASGIAAKKAERITKLQFAGAGSLGAKLNLKINEAQSFLIYFPIINKKCFF
jgi:hypothetical protein